MTLLDFVSNNKRWLSAGALLAFASSFGQTFFISIFADDIRTAFNLSHGNWGALYSIGTIASAIVMVWAGALADLFRVRSLGTVSLLGLALACLVMATSTHVIMLVIGIFLLRLTGQGMASHISRVAMARWYIATRGRALSIASLGYSVAEAFLPLIFVGLLAIFDWRLLWAGCAVLALFYAPILFQLMAQERTPQSQTTEDQSLGMNSLHWNRSSALRHPFFWCMFPAVFGISAFVTAFFFHHLHFADTKGWSHVEIVALFPVYSISGVVAMLVSGWAIDKFNAVRLAPYFQIPMAIAFVVMAFSTTPYLAGVSLIIMAMTSGTNATLTGAMWAEVYGTAHLGGIKAMATAVMVLGSAVGPLITGYLIDLGVSFESQLLAIAGYFMISTLLAAIGVAQIKNSLSFAS